jgi:cytochrome c-type biogenesis protein CcmH/NrfG
LREERQLGVVDSEGSAATYTGERCLPWAGGRTGEHYAVQGNLLAGPQVVEAMAAAFEATAGDLADRLVYALAAGQAAGGDARGRQSAAVLVVREGGGYLGLTDRYIDLHVEDHPTPVRELKRLLDIRHAQLAGGVAERLLARAAEAGPEERAVLLAEARVAVDRALVLHGSDSGYWWLSARVYLARGDLDAAASAGREALLRNPSWARLPTQTRSALGLTSELLDPLRTDPGFERLWQSLATGAAAP